MTDAIPCPGCGDPVGPNARFCATCGRPVAAAAPPAVPIPSWNPPAASYGQVLSAGGPPSIFSAAPAIQPVIQPTMTAGAAKPFGMLMLAVFVAGTAAVGLWTAWDYGYWANWSLSDDEFLWALVDGGFALCYLITSVYGFAVTPRLWRLQPAAWPTANLLAGGWLLLDLIGIALFGLQGLSVVGLVVIGGTWAYLNLTSTRALFGRKPLGLLVPAAS